MVVFFICIELVLVVLLLQFVSMLGYNCTMYNGTPYPLIVTICTGYPGTIVPTQVTRFQKKVNTIVVKSVPGTYGLWVPDTGTRAPGYYYAY